MTTMERTELGQEIETALGEVLAHVRDEEALPCRIVDDPTAEQIAAVRKRRKLGWRNFAERFGLDARAVQDWERGRRVPDRAARVLLTVIYRDPEAVMRALAQPQEQSSCFLGVARGGYPKRLPTTPPWGILRPAREHHLALGRPRRRDVLRPCSVVTGVSSTASLRY